MIDQNDAPEGMKVKAALKGTNNCKGCAYENNTELFSCSQRLCRPDEREDGQDVIFVKKEG